MLQHLFTGPALKPVGNQHGPAWDIKLAYASQFWSDVAVEIVWDAARPVARIGVTSYQHDGFAGVTSYQRDGFASVTSHQYDGFASVTSMHQLDDSRDGT